VNPIWLRGLVAPALVIGLALAAGLTDGVIAALAVAAVGALAIIVWHLLQLDALARWASGPIEAPVPEGRGTWALAYAALYHRVRLRSARQRDLRLALDRFVSGARALPEGVVVLNTNDRIQWANPRAEAHLGLDLKHDSGAPIVNLVRHPAFVQYLAAGDFSEPVIIQSTRESALTLSMQIVPFGVEEKLLMSRDITRLEAVARVRRDFIANVSHELKTPLTVLAGFIETLTDVEMDERQRQRCLALMREQSNSMQRLVEDLLTLSALESEQSPVNETEFAVVPLLLAVSSDAKALSGGRHEVTLTIRDAATLLGSREELASAFGNLVSNAVRYTPEGGRIALEWQISADGGEFTVADSGIGIASEDVPRLTERFYRVDRSRSRASGGTGLGLAIVKHVLIRHQGELIIESEAGKGSSFTVRLPLDRVRFVADGANADTAAPDGAHADTNVPNRGQRRLSYPQLPSVTNTSSPHGTDSSGPLAKPP
jgi:two-component system, OmpR family, phosphate regulon sensor histidine kinase PhoR